MDYESRRRAGGYTRIVEIATADAKRGGAVGAAGGWCRAAVRQEHVFVGVSGEELVSTLEKGKSSRGLRGRTTRTPTQPGNERRGSPPGTEPGSTDYGWGLLEPHLTGSAGRGSIRDPSNGISITERTITVEQPLEWLGKQGTLFLDEVGEIPIELQSKLLRVLQEQEFERLGSNRTIHVDARLVAATNRNLEQMVADREFRSDLYYRLKVFPVVLPPLRERPEDIPMLVRYFAQRHAQQMKKPITQIPSETLAVMCRYSWPGNVRELENFIERCVILTRDETLRVPVGELTSLGTPSRNTTTLDEAEREHILRALQESHWVIGGASGAATKLGLKRTSLQYKMGNWGSPDQGDASLPVALTGTGGP